MQETASTRPRPRGPAVRGVRVATKVSPSSTATKPPIIGVPPGRHKERRARPRRTAKSCEAEKFESEARFPGDLVGSAADGEMCRSEQAEHGQRRGRQLGQPLGDAGADGAMAIFIPPPVFDEEDAVLDLPMSAGRREQLGGRHLAGIQTGQKVTGVGKQYPAVVGGYVPINTQDDPRPGIRQGIANVVRVVQLEPEPAAIAGGPFFSTVSAAGLRSWAFPRQAFETSRISL